MRNKLDSPMKYKLLAALNLIVIGKNNTVSILLLNATRCLNFGKPILFLRFIFKKKYFFGNMTFLLKLITQQQVNYSATIEEKTSKSQKQI